MRCLLSRFLALFALMGSGCLWDDPDTGSNRFGATRKASLPPREKLPPGSLQAATQVDTIGAKILAANPDLGVRPMFLVIGAPALKIDHRGTTELYVSDGLVHKCKSDDELAAILCAELGKMVSEAQAQGPGRNPTNRDIPLAPRVGSDSVGGDPDRTRQAEQAYYEQKNPHRSGIPVPAVQDPNDLARGYLIKAGFNADELKRVAPLMRQAEANPDFDRLITAPRNGLGMPNNRP
ncbi:MAG: hypothetical protein K8T89_09655 [Planctomycetes bacterium]|nr:hypothetical protein [Planctomycetota bacterium]